MVERFNRTLEQYLSKVVNERQDDWDTQIPLFLLAYRGSIHNITGETPVNILFGRELRLPCDLQFGSTVESGLSTSDYVTNLRERLCKVHNDVRDKLKLASDRMKTRYDLRGTSAGFQEGDKVWLYNPQRRRGQSPKLQSHWEGPYCVVKRINDVVYRIQRSPKAKIKVVHLNKMAKYHGSNETVWDIQS